MTPPPATPPPTTHDLEVWGRPVRVTLTQRAQTVFAAQGEWLGRRIEARARNPRAALNLWKKQAHAAGDGQPLEPRLAALLLDLAAQDFAPAALAAFTPAAADLFTRAAVTHRPEQRRRLAVALRLNEAALTPEARARLIAVISGFGG